MAVEGIGNLVQNLADHLFGQGPAAGVETRILGTQDAVSPGATEDTFTPSTQNNSAQATAQEAGIFQLSSGTLAAPGGQIFSAPAPGVAQNAPQPVNAAADPGASQSQPPAVAGPNTQDPSTPSSQQQTTGPAASAQEQLQIQRFNASLPALGLTNSEIQQIDRIASLIRNFNPAAYTDLVQQFEARSQGSAQQNSGGASLGAAAIVGSGATGSPGVNGGNGGFQSQSILATSGAQSASGDQNSQASSNPPSANAADAQVQAVQFTLSTPNEQSPQGPTPRAAGNPSATNPESR